MKRPKILLILVCGLLLLSLYQTPFVVRANTIPVISDDDLPPVIDGNITDVEWSTSATFTTELHDFDTTIQVTTNSSHLFIGFSYSTPNFLAVNNTVPSFDSSVFNYTLGYNNQTHDWFAIVIDNNLDKAESSNSIGTATSPDDAIVIDQYNSTAYDGYADGNSSFPYKADQPILYNGTVNSVLDLDIDGTTIPGSNGSLDATVSRQTTTVLGETKVSYEITKPIDGSDAEGYDFNLQDTPVLQFKLFAWRNAYANDTLDTVTFAESSDWFSLRINDTGNGLTTKDLGDTSINFIGKSTNLNNFTAMETVFSLYGYDVTVSDSDLLNLTLTDYDLNIVVFDNENPLSTGEIESLRLYARNGGNLLVLFTNEDDNNADEFAEDLELTLLPNSALGSGDIPQLLEFNNTDITSSLPITDEVNGITNKTVERISFNAAAFNMTDIKNDNNTLLLGQEFFIYDLFDQSSLVYDETGDGLINTTESDNGFNMLSVGFSVDLEFGGRITVFPTADLLTNEFILTEDNLFFALRLITWNSRIQNTLDVASTEINTTGLISGDILEVTVNVTDSFGSTPDLPATVKVELAQVGQVFLSVELTQQGSSSIYSGSFEVNKVGFIDVAFVAFVEGWGFALGEQQDIFVESNPRSFNDLSDIDPIIVVLFLITVAIAVFAYLRTKPQD